MPTTNLYVSLNTRFWGLNVKEAMVLGEKRATLALYEAEESQTWMCMGSRRANPPWPQRRLHYRTPSIRMAFKVWLWLPTGGFLQCLPAPVHVCVQSCVAAPLPIYLSVLYRCSLGQV